MIALVSADAAVPLDPDLGPLCEAIRARIGDDYAVVSWDADVDWSSFDAVVIRSTWDYIDRLGEFLSWVEGVGRVTRLLNSADAVRWNVNKEYLLDLAAEGIPIVPTTLVRPGEAPPLVDTLHVVKPWVGAGSKGARRCVPDEVAAHVATLHAGGRTAMVQPYLDLLDERGEIEHCFIPCDATESAQDPRRLVLSHAFRKGAMLTTNSGEDVGGVFTKEEITPCDPTASSLELAHAVIESKALQRLHELAYARVHVAPYRDAAGTESLVVMEVELIEPSFYFEVSPGSVGMFADRLLARIDAPHPSGAGARSS